MFDEIFLLENAASARPTIFRVDKLLPISRFVIAFYQLVNKRFVEFLGNFWLLFGEFQNPVSPLTHIAAKHPQIGCYWEVQFFLVSVCVLQI